jgi:hypothetical protein
MIEQTAGSGAAQNGAATAILAGGLVAGAIDIAYAITANYLQSGVSPGRVLQSVASGLLGRGAFQGGAATAALGLLLHFAMTVAMAAIFLAAVRALPPLRQHLLLAGLVYGGLIYFAMRWVVVPLSRFPGDLRTFGALEFAVHAVGVGLVIALAVRRFAPMP